MVHKYYTYWLCSRGSWVIWKLDKATGYKRISRKTFRSIPGKKNGKKFGGKRKIRWVKWKSKRASYNLKSQSRYCISETWSKMWLQRAM